MPTIGGFHLPDLLRNRANPKLAGFPRGVWTEQDFVITLIGDQNAQLALVLDLRKVADL